tara:strand:+ start:81500 stop:82093 length:594 start_codon:yes stop_codon:yes gene_type:complete
MILSSLPEHPCNSVELEQYSTSGDIAAILTMEMLARGDLNQDSVVVDLGSGNGILGISTALMGASQVVLVEIDQSACAIAFEAIKKTKVGDIVEVMCCSVDESLDLVGVDLVISNPPWGFQTPKADRPFLEAIIRSEATSYLIHSAEATHIEPMFRNLSWGVERWWEADFSLPSRYPHHSKRQSRTKAAFWRLTPPS